jgi:ABC-type Fe3+-siderophore transport system permease subunit
MTKVKIHFVVLVAVAALFTGSALAYLFIPSTLLRFVGMDGDIQSNFLLRTLGAALLALSPITWSARRRDGSPVQRMILIGLAIYMFASSLVDLLALVDGVVSFVSVPSIAARVGLGVVLVWLIPAGEASKG